MILMLGVAGSGKSTQSQLLVATGKYRWLSIGEVLRREITGADLAIMQTGKMLSDEKVIGYLEQEIIRMGEGPEIIIDGFPRSVYQANWLVSKHATKNYTLSAVIHIEVAKDIVLGRLEHRGRPDDTKDAIASRFAEYDTAIQPIISDLAGHGVPIVEVDGTMEPLDVFADITRKLRSL